MTRLPTASVQHPIREYAPIVGLRLRLCVALGVAEVVVVVEDGITDVVVLLLTVVDDEDGTTDVVVLLLTVVDDEDGTTDEEVLLLVVVEEGTTEELEVVVTTREVVVVVATGVVVDVVCICQLKLLKSSLGATYCRSTGGRCSA